MRRIETYDWWNDLVAVKDSLSLRELSERFGVTPGAISAAFKRSGISRQAAPPGPRSRRQPRAKPEPLPPEAGELSRAEAPRSGSKDARILEHRGLLGTVPDAEVAQRVGVSVRTIAGYRARHGIAGYTGPRRKPDRTARPSKIDPHAHLVGAVPDRVVAQQAGVTQNAVRNYRARRQITAAPPGGQGAWRVVLTGPSPDRVIVAGSLADAARAATAAGIGVVERLEWVGELV